jgi:hypothetical protein
VPDGRACPEWRMCLAGRVARVAAGSAFIGFLRVCPLFIKKLSYLIPLGRAARLGDLNSTI